MGCAVYDMAYESKVYEWVGMHYIFNHSGIVEVYDVTGCSWWADSTFCGIGWCWVWLGGAGTSGETRHARHKPISIIINHKFT